MNALLAEQTLLTPAEVSSLLRVSPRTLSRYACEERLQAIHLTPRTLRYTEQSVRALMAGGSPTEKEA